MNALGYHVLAGEDLLNSLRRCSNGENPDAVYAELWANADHERVLPFPDHAPGCAYNVYDVRPPEGTCDCGAQS